MNGYLNYFIEANIGLVLFLAAYALLLRNETDFKIKRFFLLIGIFISLTFPLFHIQNAGTSIPTLSRVIPSYLLPEFTITGDGAIRSEAVARRECQGVDGFTYNCFMLLDCSFFHRMFIVRLYNLLRTDQKF